MNLLCDVLPETVEIGGVFYKIKTDFRDWIRFSTVFASDRSMEEKIVAMLKLFEEQIPAHFHEVIPAVFQFYAGGVGEESPKKGSVSQKAPVYDFAVDDGLIFAAFYQQYGIDLTRQKLHWWKFLALFHALSDSTQFMRVVGYRGMDLANIKNNSQREFYAKMKKLHALPVSKSERERVEKIQQALLDDGDLSDVL